MKFIEAEELFKKLFVTAKGGRLLGLDVGQKFVGVTAFDAANQWHYLVLVRKKSNIDLMTKDFQTLNSKHDVVGLVVGYPYNLQGQECLQTLQVRHFMEDLRQTGRLDGLSYTYWDENYTSKTVAVLLNPLKIHPQEAKTISDKFAAVAILQGYLDSMNRTLRSGDMLSCI